MRVLKREVWQFDNHFFIQMLRRVNPKSLESIHGHVLSYIGFFPSHPISAATFVVSINLD